MAVLAEFLNVIVPVATLERRFPGGLAAYRAAVPNRTYCDDGRLTRVGFMSPAEVGRWIDFLERQGLVFHRGDRFVDIAVVDELTGPTLGCDWLTYVQSFRDDLCVVASRDEGPHEYDVALPAGWKPRREGPPNFIPNEEVAERIEVLGEKGDVVEIRDRKTGRTGFLPKSALAGMLGQDDRDQH